jgi:hypothetical protein
MRAAENQPDSEAPDGERATSTTNTAGSARPSGPVLGVTVYEHVTSILLTWILILGVFTLGFGAVWAAKYTWGLAPQPPPKVDLIVTSDVGGGGEETGEPDLAQFVPGPDGPDISNLHSPDAAIPDTSSVKDTLMAVLITVDLAVEISDSLMIAPDLRASALLTGNRTARGTKPILGGSPGNRGGVKRSQRWEIVFDQGQTEKEYARHLDFFGVELGAIVNGRMYLASKLAADKPTVRELTATNQEKRLYFSWRGGSRRQVDVSLLGKAGVPVGGNVIVLQFYPEQTEQLLAHLERDEAQRSGKALKEGKLRMELVRKTKFAVEKESNGYRFQITKIDFFGDAPSK